VASANAALVLLFYQVPDYILATLMYTLFGRAVLALVLDPSSENYIWRFFCRLTDPVVAVVGLVTPRAAAPVVLWLFGVVWLFWLRALLLMGLVGLGLSPRAGG